MKNMALPKAVFVYVCDFYEGKPVYAVAESMEELGEDLAGERIGIYFLDSTKKLVVERRLGK